MLGSRCPAAYCTSSNCAPFSSAVVMKVAPGPRRLESVINCDPHFALSQELEAKQTLPSSAPCPRRIPISSPTSSKAKPISSNSSPSSTPQYAHGQWFPVTGVARWDEFVPIKAVWVDNQPSDRKVLDKSSRWGDMPFLMLAKCAEAQAIRKGWPEDLSNTFVGEEIDREALNLHPAPEDA